MGLGYAGVFVDDANWSFTPSPGPESHLANLLEAIRESRAESADRDEQPVPRHLAEDEGRRPNTSPNGG